MKDFMLKVLAATLELPSKGIVKLATIISPFTIKNAYVRKVYQKNINLFRLHLTLALLVILAPVAVIFVYSLFLGAMIAVKDFVVEAADELSYEFLSMCRPVVRGFREGMPK